VHPAHRGATTFNGDKRGQARHAPRKDSVRQTKTFLGAIALEFDKGFDIAIILTKGTKALARQTLERVRREFATFNDWDQLQIYDFTTLPSGLTGYELSQKLIFVVKKQSDNMNRLTKVFRETYPQLAGKRALDSILRDPHVKGRRISKVKLFVRVEGSEREDQWSPTPSEIGKRSSLLFPRPGQFQVIW
jgi:hypothetical protein